MVNKAAIKGFRSGNATFPFPFLPPTSSCLGSTPLERALPAQGTATVTERATEGTQATNTVGEKKDSGSSKESLLLHTKANGKRLQPRLIP